MAKVSKPSRLLIMKNNASGQSLALHAKLKKVHSNETRRFANDCESLEKNSIQRSQAKQSNQLKRTTWQTI